MWSCVLEVRHSNEIKSKVVILTPYGCVLEVRHSNEIKSLWQELNGY